MSKSWNRMETWLALIILGVGVILVAIPGLWLYMSATTTPLHPDAQNAPSAAHSEPSQKWADAVERGQRIMRAGLTEQNLPGVSVAVGVGGDIVWAEGFGWADVEKRIPVAPDTGFRIGTASKTLTSAAVGLLLEKGQLKLDDEIQTYVPEFPKKQWPVTLRQLMGHLAGVRNDAGDEEPVSEHCGQTLDALQRFAERPLLFEPGTRYRYSSYGWILVSGAVEAAAAEPFSTFMRKRVFEPLRMENTRTDSAAASSPAPATYYFPRFAADPRYGPQPPDDVNFSCFAGASAFVSTPTDLVRFVMAMNSGKLLKPATVQLLQTSQRLASGDETGYGLGWDLETVTVAGEQTRVVGYDGELRDGMVASFMTFSDGGIVVAVTSNISYADTSSLALRVAQAFAQQESSSTAPGARSGSAFGERISLRHHGEGYRHRCGRGRRTVLTFPLRPPPQKNRSPPSDSSPETPIPGGISSLSRTSPVRGSTRLRSLSSPSHVPCQRSPSTHVTPVTKRLDSMVRRIAPVSGSI